MSSFEWQKRIEQLKYELTKDSFKNVQNDPLLVEASVIKNNLSKLKKVAEPVIKELNQVLNFDKMDEGTSAITSLLNFNKLDEKTFAIKVKENLLVSEAWFLCFEIFDLTGEQNISWINDVNKIIPTQIKANLESFLKNITTDKNELKNELAISQSLISIRMIIRLADVFYRNCQFGKAKALLFDLNKIINRNFVRLPDYIHHLFMASTEDTFLELQEEHNLFTFEIPTPESREDGINKQKEWLERMPDKADDFIFLRAQSTFLIGKTLIRLNNFKQAERYLGEALKVIDTWRKITSIRLRFSNNQRNRAKQFIYFNNYTLFKSSVIQTYLGFSSYRQGKFKRAISQIFPVRIILSKSNWLWSSFFCSLIHAGATRRLAGTNNLILLNESRWIHQNIIDFYKNPDTESFDHSLEPTFLVRSFYEISIYYIYICEMQINNYLPSPIQENIQPQITTLQQITNTLDKADEYANLIKENLNRINYLGEFDKQFKLFWTANANHILSFVEMKKGILELKKEKNIKKILQKKIETINECFTNAELLIEKALADNKESNSLWQRVDLLTDHAQVLLESAKFQLTIGNKTVRFELALKALESLDKAYNEALKMNPSQLPYVNNLSVNHASEMFTTPTTEPRANFLGPIEIFRTLAFALMGHREKSIDHLKKWLQVKENVEYTRIRDLASDIEKDIPTASNVFFLSSEIAGDLNYEVKLKDLKEWLITNAMVGRNDEQAYELIGIKRATFYQWRKEIKNKNISESHPKTPRRKLRSKKLK